MVKQQQQKEMHNFTSLLKWPISVGPRELLGSNKKRMIFVDFVLAAVACNAVGDVE